ncbi:hypothetical protein DRJ48_00100 [Candidatus Woesearchaeota archaeon]|nr:phosphoribosyltransferase [Candidatus Woesearchaeota archaeon]RLE43731.1 MAG: hypothetical protein DRJ48_00100 [Candidatus Woesearchaeota archaeon]
MKTISRPKGVTRTEDEFGNHMRRMPDGRIYADAQSVVDVAPRMFDRFLYLRGEEIRRREALPDVFLVPGRGAYFYFYALYPYFKSYAKANGLKPPRFIPYIGETYLGQHQTIEQTRIIGLEGYVENGTINENTWAVVVEDLIDEGKTARATKRFFEERGLEQLKLDFLVDSVKFPRAILLNPWLEPRLIYVRTIDAQIEKAVRDWKIQCYELNDVPADETEAQILYKSQLKGCERLYEIILGSRASIGLDTNRGVYTPNQLLLAGFALARLFYKEFALRPDIVYAIWPDHHFEELGIGISTPAVPFVEYFRSLPKLEWIQQKRNDASGDEFEQPAQGDGVEFGLITKGLGKEFQLQSRRANPDEVAVVVANEMTPKLSKEQLVRMVGTEKLYIATIFYRSGRETDFWLHARY